MRVEKQRYQQTGDRERIPASSMTYKNKGEKNEAGSYRRRHQDQNIGIMHFAFGLLNTHLHPDHRCYHMEKNVLPSLLKVVKRKRILFCNNGLAV